MKWKSRSLVMLIANYINKGYKQRLPFSRARADGRIASCPTVMAPITRFLIPRRRVREDSRVSRDKTPGSISERGKALADTNVITRRHFPDLPRSDGRPFVRPAPPSASYSGSFFLWVRCFQAENKIMAGR